MAIVTSNLDNRIHLLKNATRLARPYGDFVVYDNGGLLGLRYMAMMGGPSKAGVEVPCGDVLLDGHAPRDVYFRRFEHELPMQRTARGAPGPQCGKEAITWSMGSEEGFASDLKAIVRAAAEMFSASMGTGHMLLWVVTGIDTSPPRISLDPADFLLSPGLRVSSAFSGWVMEDFARLSAGLFRRNRPAGCSNPSESKFHIHEFLRLKMTVEFGGETGHELLNSFARYAEIVAAASGLGPRV